MILHIYTSSALNYLPKVRRLVHSIREHHPEAQITLALADLLPNTLPTPSEFDRIIDISSLGIENWRAWTFGHTLVELATAIKPFVLNALMGGSEDTQVIYLDPDTVLFDRLDDVLAVLEHASIALTPHLVTPETTIEGIMDNEMAALKHGIYNLGFIAVRSTQIGRSFALWWMERCQRWCIDDIPNGLFTDQRWIDLVPALFDEVAIVRSPRLNVAPWNIAHRPIEMRHGRYWVGDTPLGFYHFTGFDSGAHDIMANRYGHDSPAVYRLIDDYKRFLKAASKDPLASHPWAFGTFHDGEPIPLAARRVYRLRPDLQQAFPDPYGPDFQSWWHNEGARQDTASSRAPARGKRLGALLRPGNLHLYLLMAWRIWQREGVQGLYRRWLGR